MPIGIEHSIDLTAIGGANGLPWMVLRAVGYVSNWKPQHLRLQVCLALHHTHSPIGLTVLVTLIGLVSQVEKRLAQLDFSFCFFRLSLSPFCCWFFSR